MQMARMFIPVLLAFITHSVDSSAGEILQDQADQVSQIAAFQPIGQSFAAEDNRIQSIAFAYQVLDAQAPNDALRFSLYEGEGFAGALLSAVDFMLPENYSGLFDIDFSSVLLSIGSIYTAAVSAPSGSARFGIEHTVSDVYAAGRLVTLEPLFYEINCGSSTDTVCADARFRVTPASIPEPESLLLLATAIAVMSRSPRRRRTVLEL